MNEHVIMVANCKHQGLILTYHMLK